MTKEEAIVALRNSHNLNQKQLAKTQKINRIVKHSVRVFSTTGIWYLSTWVHDSPLMIIITVAAVMLQTIVEETISDDKQ